MTEPANGLQPIYSLMSGAQHTLDMTMYELADQRAVSILEADAARGVQVRVLLDKDYSGYSVNSQVFGQLAARGVQVRWAYPTEIFHQKTITVDGRTTVIMTMNLTSEYYRADRDSRSSRPTDLMLPPSSRCSTPTGRALPPRLPARPARIWCGHRGRKSRSSR